ENAGGSGLSIGNPAIAPNVDGYVLPEQPYQALAAGNFRHVPVLDGSNHDEFRLFISECDLLDPGVCPLTASSYQALLTGEFGAEG
ncbi:hypothetical protein ACSTIA_23870, partial [Vibrio parahaemolyticus]